MLPFVHMKTLKVYEDVHTSVKIAAATVGRTTTNIASTGLRYFFGQIERGEIRLDDITTGTSEEEQESELEGTK
jgi:hypothetical protein